MTGPAVPDEVRDPRPWWRRRAAGVALGVVYLVLGAAQLVDAAVDRDHAHWLLGGLWFLGGIVWLLRPVTALRDGVLRVPVRWFRRRRVPVAEIAAFATPHPLDPALVPSAVLRDGERLLLRDVDTTLLQTWSRATGIPVVRDPKPAPPPPSQPAALS